MQYEDMSLAGKQADVVKHVRWLILCFPLSKVAERRPRRLSWSRSSWKDSFGLPKAYACSMCTDGGHPVVRFIRNKSGAEGWPTCLLLQVTSDCSNLAVNLRAAGRTHHHTNEDSTCFCDRLTSPMMPTTSHRMMMRLWQSSRRVMKLSANSKMPESLELLWKVPARRNSWCSEGV